MTKYLLKIEQDHDAERPDAGAIGRMVSFNTSHLSYEDPEQWVTSECPVCNGDGWQGPDKGYGPDDVECKNCDGEGRLQKLHPDVLATLSYYEHGRVKWMVGESTVPDFGGWDTVGLAGVIVWDGGNDERAWWYDELDDEKRAAILDGIAEAFTDWSNGECYGYILEVLDECNLGFDHAGEHVDSCWGYVGIEWLGDAVHDLLVSMDIAREDVTIAGEYGYSFEYPKDKQEKASV